MEEIIEKLGSMPTISMRYGKEDGIYLLWQNICQIDDEKARNAEVDKLVSRMIEHKDKNGFFAPDDVIMVNEFFHQQIQLDDMEIYHDFFSVLHENSKTDKSMSPNFYSHAIITTLSNYFGKMTGDEVKRRSLSCITFDKNDEPILPSIKDLKGQDCAACAEYASLSHNLWLLAGLESYFVNNLNIEHAFNIVCNSKNIYLLFDIAQHRIKPLEGNPIEKIKKQEELVIDGFTYSKKVNITH